MSRWLTLPASVPLHFGGRYGLGNYAAPLWTLTADPLLVKGGVNFQ